MKKLDLHIHTIKTEQDVYFKFSISKLKQYVMELEINGIAITNHNLFDKTQYEEIRTVLFEECNCEVFPGIEINIGGSKFGHMICITSPEDSEDFSQKCMQISQFLSQKKNSISVNELKIVFPDLCKYLWIPHLDKKPSVSPDVLKEMGNCIRCGEVTSVKKFLYLMKDEGLLVPMYFSDCRPDDQMLSFSTRQTFFDIQNITIQEIKKALLDKNHVSLTEEEGIGRFYALPNLPMSTGLNVILGERSSGKTYLMDQISQQYENIKYIKQFDLIEHNPEKAAEQFSNEVAAKRSGYAEEYFKPFSEAVRDIKDIRPNEFEKSIEDYINALVKYAHETDRADMFSKCKLYNESLFQIEESNTLSKLIDAVQLLLDIQEYKDIISKHIDRTNVKALFFDLITQYRKEYLQKQKKQWVNDAIKNIKQTLRRRSAATIVPEISFYDIQLKKTKIRTFNTLVGHIKKKTIIHSQKLGRFTVRIETRPFNGAGELHTFSGKRSAVFTPLMAHYNENPFLFLHGLIDLSDIPETDYYKYFAFVDYQIKNEYGYAVSGGERAEFKLLHEINGATNKDMLLIDEPESSFDNLFLRNSVNQIIKDLSKIIPVIIVTHNNTVGASIKPDYFIYTKREIMGDDVIYERYYGLPSSKILLSKSGKTTKNIKVLLDCLEAGEKAYNERRDNYDLLKD